VGFLLHQLGARASSLRSSVNPTAVARSLLHRARIEAQRLSATAARGQALRPTERRSQAAIDKRATYDHPAGRSPRPIIAGKRTFQFSYSAVSRAPVGGPANRAIAHVGYILRDSAIAESRGDALLTPADLARLEALDARTTWTLDADDISLDHLEVLTHVGRPEMVGGLSDFGAEAAGGTGNGASKGQVLASPFHPLYGVARVFDDERMAWTNIAGGRAELARFWRAVDAAAKPRGFDRITLDPVDGPLWGKLAKRKDAPAELRELLPKKLNPEGKLEAPLTIVTAEGRKLMGWLLEAMPEKQRGQFPNGRVPAKASYGRGDRVQHRIIAEVPWRLADANHPEAIGQAIADFALELGNRAGGQKLPWVAAVHRPYGHNDPRNWHMHFIFHDRPLSDIDGVRPNKLRQIGSADWIRGLRAAWAEACNEQLERMDAPVLLDPRRTVLIAQEAGIDPSWLPAPQTKLPPAVAALDRRGVGTVAGIRAGVTALEAAHLRADREAAAAVAGADAASAALEPFLGSLGAVRAHDRWQHEHARYVEATRAAAMLDAHMKAVARPIAAAAAHWDMRGLLAGNLDPRGTLGTYREPSARNPSDFRIPPAVQRHETTVQTLDRLLRVLPRAAEAKATLEAEAAHAKAVAAQAARRAREAWVSMCYEVEWVAPNQAIYAYGQAARDERQIDWAARMMRSFDRIADKGVAPKLDEIERAGFLDLPHTASRLNSLRRRQQRIEAVLEGRVSQDRKTAHGLAVALAAGKPLDTAPAPRSTSERVRRVWRRHANCEGVRRVAVYHLESSLANPQHLPARQRKVILAYADRQRARAEYQQRYRRWMELSKTPPATWPGDLTTLDRFAALTIQNDRINGSGDRSMWRAFGPPSSPDVRAFFLQVQEDRHEAALNKAAAAPPAPSIDVPPSAAPAVEVSRPIEPEAPAHQPPASYLRAIELSRLPHVQWDEERAAAARAAEARAAAIAKAQRAAAAAAEAERQAEERAAKAAAERAAAAKAAEAQANAIAAAAVAAEARRAAEAAAEAERKSQDARASKAVAAEPTPQAAAPVPVAAPTIRERANQEFLRVRVASPAGEFGWPEAGRIARGLLRLDRRVTLLERTYANLRRAGATERSEEAGLKLGAASAAINGLLRDIKVWTRGVPELADWQPSSSNPAYDAYRLVSAAKAPDEVRRDLAMEWASRPLEAPTPNRVPEYRREEIRQAMLAIDPHSLERLVRKPFQRPVHQPPPASEPEPSYLDMSDSGVAF
jgi:hypothetical protein